MARRADIAVPHRLIAGVASLKNPGGHSPSNTVLETAHTTAILIRFCVAIDSVDAIWAGDGAALDFLRFGFGDVFLAGTELSEASGSGPFEA